MSARPSRIPASETGHGRVSAAPIGCSAMAPRTVRVLLSAVDRQDRSPVARYAQYAWVMHPGLPGYAASARWAPRRGLVPLHYRRCGAAATDSRHSFSLVHDAASPSAVNTQATTEKRPGEEKRMELNEAAARIFKVHGILILALLVLGLEA